jgi:hypothetical protein
MLLALLKAAISASGPQTPVNAANRCAPHIGERHSSCSSPARTTKMGGFEAYWPLKHKW